jgi:hypothetical protein
MWRDVGRYKSILYFYFIALPAWYTPEGFFAKIIDFRQRRAGCQRQN